MARILACIDDSAYANSVCDHAGWFASDPDIGVEVMHADEQVDGRARSAATSKPSVLIDRAVRRLEEEGVGPITAAAPVGPFVEVAISRGAAVIVLGKRGSDSGSERGRLGSSIDPIVRATSTPICLASKVFLPIRRAVVLLDADLAHRAAVSFAAAEPRLSDIPIDVVVMATAADNPGPKLEWARRELEAAGSHIFPLSADGLDEAVARYMESRSADLIIVSRAVVAPDPAARLGRLEDGGGLWGVRTPVLIC